MNSDAHRSLEVVLDRELEAAHALATTLDAERVALTGKSPEAVMEKAAEKTQLFGVIEALEAERNKLCSAAQISLPKGRKGQTLAVPGVSESVAERWRALLELIARCRMANEINGYIINTRRGQLNQLFQVLRGGAPITYSPQGKTFAKSLRALAQA
jgi:flagellar biosynthesis/type III secretory pathway chaperone